MSILVWLLLAFLNLALSVTLAFTALGEGRIAVHRIGVGFRVPWVVAELDQRPGRVLGGVRLNSGCGRA
jgi:hypothetical protein